MKVIVEVGPTVMENTAFSVSPPSEVKGTVKLADPCCDCVRVLIGVIV